jgi:hypothetical protein
MKNDWKFHATILMWRIKKFHYTYLFVFRHRKQWRTSHPCGESLPCVCSTHHSTVNILTEVNIMTAWKNTCLNSEKIYFKSWRYFLSFIGVWVEQWIFVLANFCYVYQDSASDSCMTGIFCASKFLQFHLKIVLNYILHLNILRLQLLWICPICKNWTTSENFAKNSLYKLFILKLPYLIYLLIAGTCPIVRS